MATFNPYKEAAGDAAMQRNATKRWWKGWCRKCNTETPMKGGKTQDKVKGSAFGGRSGGVVQRFVCADCLAKMGETPNYELTGAA